MHFLTSAILLNFFAVAAAATNPIKYPSSFFSQYTSPIYDVTEYIP